jgi:hypothetical protein
MKTGIVDRLKSLMSFMRYHAGRVYSGRFIYFLLSSAAIFLAVVIIHSLSQDSTPGAATIYNFLLVPGMLLAFYPSAYSIQGDADARMLETLFGIPDYQFKVWLGRSLVHYLLIAVILLVLALLARLGLAGFPVVSMVGHLMFPVVFLGSLGFFLAAFTRSGNSAAAVIVAVVLFFWIASESLDESAWNLFHNPFMQVEQLETLAWRQTTTANRVYLLIGSVVLNLLALIQLQHRERYIS